MRSRNNIGNLRKKESTAKFTEEANFLRYKQFYRTERYANFHYQVCDNALIMTYSASRLTCVFLFAGVSWRRSRYLRAEALIAAPPPRYSRE